jgi:hypothetical protein
MGLCQRRQPGARGRPSNGRMMETRSLAAVNTRSIMRVRLAYMTRALWYAPLISFLQLFWAAFLSRRSRLTVGQGDSAIDPSAITPQITCLACRSLPPCMFIVERCYRGSTGLIPFAVNTIRVIPFTLGAAMGCSLLGVPFFLSQPNHSPMPWSDLAPTDMLPHLVIWCLAEI